MNLLAKRSKEKLNHFSTFSDLDQNKSCKICICLPVRIVPTKMKIYYRASQVFKDLFTFLFKGWFYFSLKAELHKETAVEIFTEFFHPTHYLFYLKLSITHTFYVKLNKIKLKSIADMEHCFNSDQRSTLTNRTTRWLLQIYMTWSGRSVNVSMIPLFRLHAFSFSSYCIPVA